MFADALAWRLFCNPTICHLAPMEQRGVCVKELTSTKLRRRSRINFPPYDLNHAQFTRRKRQTLNPKPGSCNLDARPVGSVRASRWHKPGILGLFLLGSVSFSECSTVVEPRFAGVFHDHVNTLSDAWKDTRRPMAQWHINMEGLRAILLLAYPFHQVCLSALWAPYCCQDSLCLDLNYSAPLGYASGVVIATQALGGLSGVSGFQGLGFRAPGVKAPLVV